MDSMLRIEHMYREQRKFEQTIGGLLAVINMLKGVSGRKNLLLISAGIPDLSPEDFFPNMQRGTPEGNMYNTRDYFRFENVRAFDPFNIMNKKELREGETVLREIIRFANSQNISVYSFDSDIYVKMLFSGASAEAYQKYQLGPRKLLEQDKMKKVQNLR